MFTPGFTAAVDALTNEPSISDDTLHARAHRYLDVLSGSNPAQLSGPSWAERIQKVIPEIPSFSTFHLFEALYDTADELRLVAGKRYVSATICVCADRITPAAPVGVDGAPDPEGQSPTNPDSELVQGLDHLASIWAAFVLWPFYSYGADDDLNPAPDRRWKSWNDTMLNRSDSEGEREQRDRGREWRWKAQVMARDNYRCFMSGNLDVDWYLKHHPKPTGNDDVWLDDCDVVPIIRREAIVGQDGAARCGATGQGDIPDADADLDTMRHILKRYFGADETLLEKAEGSQNALFVGGPARSAFRQFFWCLHPTETPDRYKITRHGPRGFLGSRHISSHVTFADHSQSPAPSCSYCDSLSHSSDPTPVDLPDRALLRLHAALASVLWYSGAVAAFSRLFSRPWWLPGRSRWPAPNGEAFWRGVVAYEGEETCAEVELDLAAEALRKEMRERERERALVGQ